MSSTICKLAAPASDGPVDPEEPPVELEPIVFPPPEDPLASAPPDEEDVALDAELPLADVAPSDPEPTLETELVAKLDPTVTPPALDATAVLDDEEPAEEPLEGAADEQPAATITHAQSSRQAVFIPDAPGMKRLVNPWRVLRSSPRWPSRTCARQSTGLTAPCTRGLNHLRHPRSVDPESPRHNESGVVSAVHSCI